MFDIGRVVMKIAGRDAGQLGVVVEVLDETHILIDGGVRRRKVSVKHVEPTSKTVEIKKGAAHVEVLKALGLNAKKKGSKERKEKGVKPAKVRKVKPKKEESPKKKKVVKKEEVKAEKKNE
jgi:large subunit ribosomal protein L14e